MLFFKEPRNQGERSIARGVRHALLRVSVSEKALWCTTALWMSRMWVTTVCRVPSTAPLILSRRCVKEQGGPTYAHSQGGVVSMRNWKSLDMVGVYTTHAGSRAQRSRRIDQCACVEHG
jgi:hypothetical protein